MLKYSKSAIAGMVVAAVMSAVSITTVSPANAGGNNWRHGNWNRGNWNHGNWNHGGWNYSNNYWAGPAIGLGAGLVFGAILAQPRYYAPGYAPQYGNRHVGGNAPVYDAQCLDARARHGENSAEAMTFC
jgi:hypothetical protein